MPVFDLNDYIRSSTGPPGSVTTTCMRCGITEPHTRRGHVCAAPNEPRRRRRREAAAKRLNRIRAKLGKPLVLQRCDFCGRDLDPDKVHWCMPDPRPSQPQFAAPWLTTTEREAPPMFGTYDPNPNPNPDPTERTPQ